MKQKHTVRLVAFKIPEQTYQQFKRVLPTTDYTTVSDFLRSAVRDLVRVRGGGV